jgi:hypothetical protein
MLCEKLLQRDIVSFSIFKTCAKEVAWCIGKNPRANDQAMKGLFSI